MECCEARAEEHSMGAATWIYNDITATRCIMKEIKGS